MSFRLLLAVAVAAAAAPVASAQAAPQWSPPAPIKAGAPQGLPGAPSITANSKNLAIAVSDVGGALPQIGPHAMAGVFTNGGFGDPFALAPLNTSYGPEAGGVAAYGSTRLLASGLFFRKNSTQAIFSFGRLTPGHADLGAARPLGPSDMHAGRTALAVNADGDAAMVYPVCRDAACRKVLVYLAVRRAGSSKISSTRLADGSGPLPRVTAAINARGDALAVWTQSGTVYARIRTAGGTLRARQTVGTTNRGTNLPPSAALSAHRAELVGWVDQGVSEGDGSAGATQVTQARDGGRFATPTQLAALPAGTGNYVSEAGVRVAYDPSGRRLLAWTGYNGAHFTVQTAELDGTALLDPQTVSNPGLDTILGDAVTDSTGRQLLAMVGGTRGNDAQYPSNPNTPIFAALRPANGTGPFAVEQISDGRDYSLDARGAFLNDRQIIVWGSLTNGAMFSQRIGA